MGRKRKSTTGNKCFKDMKYISVKKNRKDADKTLFQI